MANSTPIPLIPLLFFFLFLLTPPITARQSHGARARSRSYIKSSCRDTRYAELCTRSLTGYAEAAKKTILTPRDLAQHALLYSLFRARSTRAFLLRAAGELKDSRAIKDCLAQIDLSVDELSMSIKELHEFARVTPSSHRDHERNEVSWHISNVEAWVGSALTGASNCVDEIRGMRMSKLRATVRAKVLNVAEVTSVALALFHRFASCYPNP